MRPLSLGTYRWVAAGLATLGVADLVAVNLVVGPAWIAASETPALASQASAAQPPPPARTALPTATPSTQAAPAATPTTPPIPSPASSPSVSAPASATAAPVAATTADRQPVARPAPPEGAHFGTLTFGTNSAVLTAEARGTLMQVAGQMRNRHKLIVRVHGHSDGAGSRELNQWLSVERAKAARAYLGELGVDISRVHAAGFGADRPTSSCSDASCPANRRVEILFEETP